MADSLPTIFTPHNLEEAMKFCERLAKTNFVPKDYVGKPNEILAAIQFGAEVGIGPMQSLQSIAVINGRPSLWGDALLGLVQRSGLLEYIKETETDDAATCEVKRKGDKEACRVTFSHADAIKAGLANKQGPWTQYPKRMRTMRARGFALRNKFADVLKGLISREEAQDYQLPGAQGETVDVTEAQPPPPDDLPTATDGTEAPTPRRAHVEVVKDNDRTLNDEEQIDVSAFWKQMNGGKDNPKGLMAFLTEVAGVQFLEEVKLSQLNAVQEAMQARA